MKKNFLHKAFILMIATVTFSVTACDKDDAEEAAPTNTDAACKVTEVTAGDEEPSKREYNEEGYISTITSTEVFEDKIIASVTTFIYDDSNRLQKTEERVNDILARYKTYTYRDGVVETVKEYDGEGILQATTTYTYNENKKVAEATEVSEDGSYTTKYTYDSKGNVEKEEDFRGEIIESRIIYSNYDDKPTPFAAIKGLPALEEGLSKNNPGSKTSYSMYDLDDDETPDEQDPYNVTYTYIYNSDGFPEKVIATDDYGYDEEIIYTYACNLSRP